MKGQLDGTLFLRKREVDSVGYIRKKKVIFFVLEFGGYEILFYICASTLKLSTMFAPSKFQSAIYDFILKGIGNAVINAVAGSGKTSTLLQALGLLPKSVKVLFLAFNRSIKEELEHKVSGKGFSNVKISTCHGFGFTVVMDAVGKRPNIDDLKYKKLLRPIVDQMVKDGRVFEEGEKAEYIKAVLRLADLGRMNLTTDPASLLEIARKYSIFVTTDECEMASKIVEMGAKDVSVLDFVDMVYFPIRMRLNVKQYDIVFIDECQDLNAAQRELMIKALAPNGRFIAVGDKNQAIYGFAGADAESFDKLVGIENTTSLPLSVCYRCGSDIIDLAKGIVPAIEAFEGNGKGIVKHDASVREIMAGDMVLCRNTYPLVKLCLNFLKAGIKATIMGSEIGRSLIKLVKDTNEAEMPKVFDKLYHDLDLLEKRIMRSNKCTSEDAKASSEYGNALERIQVIEALCGGSEGVSAEVVIAKLTALFSDKTEGIILSTIHKSKGLEADRVFIIHPEKMPSKYARQEWELVQEENLRYVAYTRAKHFLGFVVDFDAYANCNESFAERVSAVKPSNHVGTIGGKYALEGTVTECRYIPNYDAMVYTIQDGDGNLFEKWGDIPSRFINGGEVKEGTIIRAYVTISKHTEFRGVKKNTIKNFANL